MNLPTIGELTNIGTLIVAAMVYLQSRKNGKIIKEVKHQSNSMKDELVAEVRKSSHAKGMKDEKEKEEEEVKTPSPLSQKL